MDEINLQVKRAKRRLALGRFFKAFAWSIFAGLLLTSVGLAIPKIWHIGFLSTQNHHDAWTLAWLVGGGLLGLVVACVLTIRGRESAVATAAEVDRRFGLKERLSSALAMPAADRAGDAGQALLADAENVASTIDVRDQFPFQPNWRMLLPLIPIALLVGLMFLPNAQKQATAVEAKRQDRKKVEVAIETFKKDLAAKKKELAAKGLKASDLDLTTLEKQFDQLLDDKSSTKKDALVKLNDIKQQIKERQKNLGSSDELRQSLNRLSNVGTGVAKKVADAMSKGDLKEAKRALKELADQLKSGKLSPAKQKELAKDLNALAKQMKEIAKRHEQEKARLKEQVQRALDQGDLNRAAELQQQLENKQQQDQQQKKLEKMADNLQRCADCMKQGQQANGQPKQGQQAGKQSSENGGQQAQARMQEAGEALDDLADQIAEMQEELEEMENLEDLEQIACDCQGNMNGDAQQDQPPQWKDFAKGRGNGAGKRDLEKSKIGTFKSRVKAKLQRGETVITGSAEGDNISGRSVSQARELIQAEMSKDTDPLENQQLPRSQREHARQYFEALRNVE